jgi:hypothetical protein
VSQFEFSGTNSICLSAKSTGVTRPYALNVHFDGLFVYFLHFAPKTNKGTIDDLHNAAFEPLMMFSHTTIQYIYRSPCSRGPYKEAYRR